MSYIKIVSGKCPEQNRNYEIKVKYIEYEADNAPKEYVTQLHYCEYDDINNCSYSSNCPIVMHS